MTADEIETWILSYAAAVLRVPPATISTQEPFDALGLDSASAVALIGDLEDWLQFELTPTLAYEHPTIEELALVLAGLTSDGAAAKGPQL